MPDKKLKDSLLERHQALFCAAAIAAHASSQGQGFRQKQIRFLIELFANWVEVGNTQLRMNLQTTQVTRFLEQLVSNNLARKRNQKNITYFKLTRAGLVTLLDKIVKQNYIAQSGQFFFFYYFIKNYRKIIENVIEAEGSLFPKAIKIELDHLLDLNRFLKQEINAAEKEAQRIRLRIEDSKATSELTKSLLKQKMPFPEIMKIIEKEYPYELNSQKPISELIQEVPIEMRQWEMEYGTQCRSKEIWQPLLRQVLSYLGELKGV